MTELFVQSRYSVNRDYLRREIDAFMQTIGVDPVKYTLSVAIVGDRKMAQIHKKFKDEKGTTPVLAFSMAESGINYTTDRSNAQKEQTDLPTIGEIVISYPQALIFAADENKLVDKKLFEFVQHGLTQLLSN